MTASQSFQLVTCVYTLWPVHPKNGDSFLFNHFRGLKRGKLSNKFKGEKKSKAKIIRKPEEINRILHRRNMFFFCFASCLTISWPPRLQVKQDHVTWICLMWTMPLFAKYFATLKLCWVWTNGCWAREGFVNPPQVSCSEVSVSTLCPHWLRQVRCFALKVPFIFNVTLFPSCGGSCTVLSTSSVNVHLKYYTDYTPERQELCHELFSTISPAFQWDIKYSDSWDGMNIASGSYLPCS